MSDFFTLTRNRFPPVVKYIIILLCLLPLLFYLLGVPNLLSHYSKIYPDSNLIKAIFDRDKIDIIYEWTSFCSSFFLFIICFFLYFIKRDPTILIIGFALFFSGIMDGFHAIFLEASFYKGHVARNVEAFSWLVSRFFTSLILFAEIVTVLYIYPKPTRKQENYLLACALTGLIFILGIVLYFLLIFEAVPMVVYTDQIVARPYELIPLLLFFICYPLLNKLYTRFPGYFSHSLILALIPCIAMQLYLLSFPFIISDYHLVYDIAHLIKLLIFLVPFLGICFDQYFVFQDSDFLISSNKELKDLSDQKTHFLTMASHDLRNPASAIQMSANFYLQMQPNEQETKDLMETIQRSSNHMITLLNEFFDLSTLETGKLKMEFEKVDLVSLIKTLVHDNLSLTAAKKLKFTYQHTNSSLKVVCDPVRIREVLMNFVSNAIKFCRESDQITVSSEDHMDSVVIYVTDTGVGIKEEILHVLFDPNECYTTKGTEGEKGTGFGLAICSKIIKAHHGEIWAESIDGEGSTFAIKLPKTQPQNSV